MEKLPNSPSANQIHRYGYVKKQHSNLRLAGYSESLKSVHTT